MGFAVIPETKTGELMENLQSLELNKLLEMLSQYTSNYTKMLSEGSKDDEFASCYLRIRALQAEIQNRRRTDSQTNLSEPGINYSE